jgi:predicted nuclease of predicted toxin-antitoxin system
MTEPAESVQLLLDEMFSPRVAAALRERGHKVIALVERPEMRTMSDEEVFAWAAAQRCWLLTENVKDFQPIKLRALQANAATVSLLFTSSRTFPRSRQHVGPLISALDAWLAQGPPDPPIIEDWPQPV